MRILIVAVATILLSGCTSMMLGGANSGGYQPPKDECSGEQRDDENCEPDA